MKNREDPLAASKQKLLEDLHKAEKHYLSQKKQAQRRIEGGEADEWLKNTDAEWVEQLKELAETSQLIELGTPDSMKICEDIFKKPAPTLTADDVTLLKLFCRDINPTSLRKSQFSHVLFSILVHDPQDKGHIPAFWEQSEGKSLLELYESNSDRLLRSSNFSRPRSRSLFGHSSEGSSPRGKETRSNSVDSGSPRNLETRRNSLGSPRKSLGANSPRGSFGSGSPRGLTPRNKQPLLVKLLERSLGDTTPLVEITLSAKAEMTLNALQKPFSQINRDDFYILKNLIEEAEPNNKLLRLNNEDAIKLGSIISYLKRHEHYENDDAHDAMRHNISDGHSIADLYFKCRDITLDGNSIENHLKDTAYNIHLWLEIIKIERDEENISGTRKSLR